MRDESPSISDIRALRLCVPLSVSVVLAKTQGQKKKSIDESGPSSDDIETAHALPLFSALAADARPFYPATSRVGRAVLIQCRGP